MKTNVPTRWVEFSGIDNVRDLGGLPVAGNRRTRFGLAYRSSTLQELTDADLGAFLGPIGLNTIIDLRLPHEARREGHGRLADTSVCRINLPVRKTDANPSDVVPDSR
ncbi:MAG: tyrosine-protein phosphatase, partial [Haloechinothrix sp.]